MQPNSINEFMDFASHTAYTAGRMTLGTFQTQIDVDIKSDGSPVTVTDRSVEAYIRAQIGECYPSHAILGEELGEQGSGASHRWIIDPIDGTKSFVRGVPLYATLLGLEIDGEVKVGAAYFPALDELLVAGQEQGCWWNGRRSKVSAVARLEQATVACTTTMKFAQYGRQLAWDRLLNACYFQTGWGDAYGYALVATGRIEIMLDPVMSAWDAAPLLPILREAGGYFGDWHGRQTIYGGEGLASNAALLDQVLAILN